MGDMLYSGPNSTSPVRVTVRLYAMRKFTPSCRTGKRAVVPQYVDGITSDTESEGGGSGFDGGEELDPLFDQAS